MSIVVSIAGLGPPILSTYVRASSIHVNATLPLGPKEVSIENIIIDSKNGPIKTSIEYTLTITSPAWAAQVNLQKQYGFQSIFTLINRALEKTKQCSLPLCLLGKGEYNWQVRPQLEKEPVLWLCGLQAFM